MMSLKCKKKNNFDFKKCEVTILYSIFIAAQSVFQMYIDIFLYPNDSDDNFSTSVLRAKLQVLLRYLD